jgi:hypothetical protein
MAPKTLVKSLYHQANDFYNHCTAITRRAPFAPSAVSCFSGAYCFVLAIAANRARAARGA